MNVSSSVAKACTLLRVFTLMTNCTTMIREKRCEVRWSKCSGLHSAMIAEQILCYWMGTLMQDAVVSTAR